MEKLKEFIKTVGKEDISLLLNFMMIVLTGISGVFILIGYLINITFRETLYLVGIGTEISYLKIFGFPFLYVGIVILSFICLNVIIEVFAFVVRVIKTIQKKSNLGS